jgi:hypothetical protein
MVNGSRVNCPAIEAFVQNWDVGWKNPKAFFNHIERIGEKIAPNRVYFCLLVRVVAKHQMCFCPESSRLTSKFRSKPIASLMRSAGIPEATDWRWACAVLHQNEGIEESGVAAAVLGHPATGVAWLANKLSVQGVGLEAGQIVLGGSFTAPVNITKGDVFCADYGPLGQIRTRFT